MNSKRRYFGTELSELEKEVLKELSEIPSTSPDFEYAQNIVSLHEEGYLVFCYGNQWKTGLEGSTSPHLTCSEDDFCFLYYGPLYADTVYADPAKKSTTMFAKGSEHFTAVMNYILGYLTERKGITIKQVRINKAPVTDAVKIPEGTAICDLSETEVTSNFYGPRTLQHLDVSWCKDIDSGLDLTIYPNLKIFRAGYTQIDDCFIPPKTLKSLVLTGCPAGDAIPLHEGLEAFGAPYKTTHQRDLPTTLLDYNLCSSEIRGPLRNLPRLKTFYFSGEGLDPGIRFQRGLRELDLFCVRGDITDIAVPDSVENFTFSPSSVGDPARFYEKLPPHLKRKITWTEIANCSTREEANRWSFLKPPLKQVNPLSCLLDRSIEPEYETEDNLFPEYQSPLHDRVEVTSPGSITKPVSETIVNRLIANGISEEHAIAATHFFEVSGGDVIDERSKNTVYEIRDLAGTVHIIKFSRQKAEAETEAAVNYHFGRDQRVKRYVAKSDLEKPIECLVEGSPVYVTLQERQAADPFLNLLWQGKGETEKYLTEWMRILAKLHVYGTQIMNNVGQHTGALRLSKEKDEERIALANHIAPLVKDQALRKALTSAGIEEGRDFIHQDIRIENRIGFCAIDWGHAGRGNYLLDIARVLSDAAVQKYKKLDDATEKKYIAVYLRERRTLEGDNLPLSRVEIDATHREYQVIQLLYYQAQSAYQLSRNPGLLRVHERATLEFQVSAIPQLERAVAENLDQVSQRQGALRRIAA